MIQILFALSPSAFSHLNNNKTCYYVTKEYLYYCGMKLWQDKRRARHWVCRASVENFQASTMEKEELGCQRESLNQYDDCYFCLVNISGFSYKTKSSISYSNLRPVPHSDEITPPIFTSLVWLTLKISILVAHLPPKVIRSAAGSDWVAWVKAIQMVFYGHREKDFILFF